MLWLVVAAIGLVGCGGSTTSDEIVFEALLAGQSVSEATPRAAIELRPDEVVDLTLLMTNTSDRPVTVAHVRLEGELLGFIFLTYDTGIRERLQPGEERVVRFPVDFFDLDSQAHGLLRSRIVLFDDERQALGATALTVDARGGLGSTMVVFNLVLALFAIVSLAWNLYRSSLRRLPQSRAVRGLQFVHSGVALGLTFAVACSTLRLWPLAPPAWLGITALLGAAAFAVGLFSPGPDDGMRFPVINLTEDGEESIHITNQF